jgi:hypothetical protein
MEQIDNLQHIHTTKQVYIQHIIHPKKVFWVNPTKQFNNQLNMQFFNFKISVRIQSAKHSNLQLHQIKF